MKSASPKGYVVATRDQLDSPTGEKTGKGKVLIAAPRSFCAGVDRAIEVVERLLQQHGAPVYVRHQIVHNEHVVRRLEGLGAVFVESEDEIPTGQICVLSAHGVAPAVKASCEKRGLRVIDATCPLVSKVHAEARSYAAGGFTIALVGHEEHEEVVGTRGEAPEATVVIGSVAAAEAFTPADRAKVAYVTQTTLSMDETAEILAVLRRRFPAIVGPPKDDICYATTNRQNAVKEMLPLIDLLLVVGSGNSSNSNRLVDVALGAGVPAHLIEDAGCIDEAWLDGIETVGLTSGASAPERLVTGVLRWFRERGVEQIERLDGVVEDIEFRLPSELRQPARPAPAAV